MTFQSQCQQIIEVGASSVQTRVPKSGFDRIKRFLSEFALFEVTLSRHIAKIDGQLEGGQITLHFSLLATWFIVSQFQYTHFGYYPMKVARIYLRVSTEEQDLTRQTDIVHSAREEGYYIAGIYREKASGARADRPELLQTDIWAGRV